MNAEWQMLRVALRGYALLGTGRKAVNILNGVLRINCVATGPNIEDGYPFNLGQSCRPNSSLAHQAVPELDKKISVPV
jgi:hypothetical protein